MTPQSTKTGDSELRQKIQWLNRYRFLFTLVLLGSTLFFHFSRYSLTLNTSLIILYAAIAVLLFLCPLYTALQRRSVREDLFAYVQITIDSVVVTVILLVTGFFESVFVFLYLVVIIYTSILLHRRGSLVMAALCSFEYLLLVFLYYSEWLRPLASANLPTVAHFQWHLVAYRTVITVFACFAVALLSSHLAEQARRTRKELKAMGDRVRRVEKMAAVGEMGAGLAHEIKNPLASITGSIQLLREEIPFESGRDKLMQIILREADRLSALVGNFLLFARPPSGKSVPIDLDSAIPETIRLVEQDRRFRNTVTIEQSGPCGLWIIMDPDHFRQILWNLLLNAVEAIDGEGWVGVSVDTTKNGYIGIRISDDGCGISEAQMQSIFDPFYTSKPHGTGLGLSIVHSILESYEGWLEVESRAGQGTHFTMKIRRIPPPAIT